MGSRELCISNGFFGNIIKGTLQTPDEDKKYPLIILVHGMTGHKDQELYINMGEVFVEQGFACYRFSFGTRLEKDVSRFHIRSELDELNRVIEVLSTEKTIDKKNIYLVGHSYGGAAVIMETERNNKVKAAAALSPKLIQEEQYDLEHDWHKQCQKNGFFKMTTSEGIIWKIHRAFFDEHFKHTKKMQKALHNFKKPLFLSYGEHEDLWVTKEVETISNIVWHSKLLVVPGADHAYRNWIGKQKGQKWLAQRISSFFKHLCS